MLQALVRTVIVIVAAELGQHLAELPLAEDQEVIQALTAKRAREPAPRMNSRVATGPVS